MSASGSSFERGEIARRLYRERGAGEAELRQSLNQRLAQHDLVDVVMGRLGLAPGAAALDVGCGSGAYLAAMQSAVGPAGIALGVDFSMAAVAACRDHGLLACQADATALPLPPQAFAAITCNYAAYYFTRLDAALREWRRVLRPGGIVIATGPDHGNNEELYAFHREVAGRLRSDADLMATGFVAGRLADAAGAAGLRVEACDTLVNPVRFPAVADFIRYWGSTSLFVSTVAEAERAAVIARGEELLAAQSAGFVVTKRVAILRLG